MNFANKEGISIYSLVNNIIRERLVTENYLPDAKKCSHEKAYYIKKRKIRVCFNCGIELYDTV